MKFQLFFTWAVAVALTLNTGCVKEDEWDESEEDDIGSILTGSDVGDDEGALTLYKVSGNTISKMKDYQVPAGLQSFQNDRDKHNEMWDFVVTLFPAEERTYIENYEVFHGGGDLLGWVSPTSDDDLGRWTFALDIFHAYTGETFNGDGEFAFTTIHEFAHIYTLNETQFDENAFNENGCDSYFNGNCAFSSAYLETFVDRFWADILDEWLIADENDDQDALDAFADRYRNRWPTEYASTSPEEDIAEAFTLFVLDERPTGNSIADKKVAFFYNYGELVTLRNHIRDAYAHPVSAKTTSASVFAGRKHRCLHHR